MNRSISQIETSIESLANNRWEWVENTVSGTENQVEELDQSLKDHEKMLRKYEWNMQNLWDTTKRLNLWIMGIKEGRDTNYRYT
jgi:chromosome segregation ATPase